MNDLRLGKPQPGQPTSSCISTARERAISRALISGGSSSIAKDGSGTLILGNADNSFSGQIFVHNGTLQFASIQNVGGGNSALGAPTTAAFGTIYLAGTLAYVGSGSSSNRVIDVADGPRATGATGVIDASGSGPLNLTRRRDLRE